MELSIAMYKQGFWEEGDVQLTHAWLHDLLAIGYTQPIIRFDYYYKGLGDAVDALPKKGEQVATVCELKLETVSTEEPAQLERKEGVQLFTIMFNTQGILAHMRDFVGLLHQRDFKGTLIVFYDSAIPSAAIVEVGNFQGVSMVDMKSFLKNPSLLTKELLNTVLAYILKEYTAALYVNNELSITDPVKAIDTVSVAFEISHFVAMKRKSTDQLQQLNNEGLYLIWSRGTQNDLQSVVVLATDRLMSDSSLLTSKPVVPSLEGFSALPPEDTVGVDRPWCFIKHRVLYPPMNIKENMIPASSNNPPKICILLPTVGRGSNDQPAKTPDEVEGFEKFVASFLKTLVPAYNFTLYLGYDIGDPFYDNDANHEACQNWVNNKLKHTKNTLNLELRGFPKAFTNNVFFWNHLAFEAYKDGCDYNFQMGDDMKLTGNAWNLLIEELKTKTLKPNFGVIEPRHVGGNIRVHVISFVHSTHYEIFGHHFPPELYNWWADDWMTDVYTVHHSALWLERDRGMAMDHLVHQRYSHCPHHKDRMPALMARAEAEVQAWLKGR